MKRVRFHPAAKREYVAAVRTYESHRPGFGELLQEVVEAGVRRVAEAPLRWPLVGKSVRRHVLPRFPYASIYALHERGVVVLALAHGRRRPSYWARRKPTT